MKIIVSVWIKTKMSCLIIKSNIKEYDLFYCMSIYVISGNHLNHLVKIGMTFNPINRIRNMQTYHPEPVRYIRIYTLIFSNDITLRTLESNIFELLKSYKYISPHFQDDEKKPTEFYSGDIVQILDNIMEFYKNHGAIDYVKFDNLNSYMMECDRLENWDLWEILKGRDKAYQCE